VVIPALRGTLERGPSPPRLPSNQERERALRWSADVGRTLEYLDTRGANGRYQLMPDPSGEALRRLFRGPVFLSSHISPAESPGAGDSSH
jgi:hypothetical protein